MSSSNRITIPAPARGAFAAVQAVSSDLAARLAERWFFTPPRRNLGPQAEAFLTTGRRFTLTTEGGDVVGWEYGAGPTVYLVHGWGGRAGRWWALAEPLLDLGYRVVTFDAPGHGASPGKLSSIPEFARALMAVVADRGPAHAVVAHSLGGAATALAASWGLDAGRFVLLAPPADPASWAEEFGEVLGARPEVMALTRSNSERRLNFSWDDLDVLAAVRDLPAAALVVHDLEDDVVPFGEGAAVAEAWPRARLASTTGLGHRGLLRDERVVEEVIGFVASGRPVMGPDAVPVEVPAGEAGRLEYQLFHRDAR